MQEPLISIIIPCYNAQAFIAKTINCILKQTYKNWEIICMNDGSTDNSENIIKNPGALVKGKIRKRVQKGNLKFWKYSYFSGLI